MKSARFWLALLAITLLGLGLRVKDYDRIPPFLETADEVMFPWAGMSWLTTGVPSSWTWLPAPPHGQRLELWGAGFTIVTPWLEKPPLFSLLTGGVSLLFGDNAFADVRLATIRLTPLTLSVATMILVGLLARSLFGPAVGLLAALLYATIPTIAIANRLALSENLLTPITLATLWLLTDAPVRRAADTPVAGTTLLQAWPWHRLQPYLLGLGSGLAILTRQTGLALLVVVVGTLLYRRQWRTAATACALTLALGALFPLLGYLYDWELFKKNLSELRFYYAYGLPSGIAALFRFPMITHKTAPFVDGSMVLGYLLLLAAPLVSPLTAAMATLLAFPLTYLVVLALVSSGFFPFGWHFFPLFPFVAIIMAKTFADLWRRPRLWASLTLFLILGFSSLRFLVAAIPGWHAWWQFLGVVSLLVFLAPLALPRQHSSQRWRQGVLLAAFAVFLSINALVVWQYAALAPQLRELG